MNHEEFEQAAAYWTSRDAALDSAKRMEASELRELVEGFLAAHKVCALATCADGTPRCTPLEYDYRDGALWVFSEGGLKFRGLEPAEGEDSAPVSLAVFDPNAKFTQLKSLQIDGRATVVDPDSPEFTDAVAAKGVPAGGQAALAAKAARFAEMLHLIKVTPEKIDLLDSALKQQGYSVRQHLAW